MTSFSSPPPPPPPIYPKPKREVYAHQDKILIEGTKWPYRLLHVASMVSYIRENDSTYNGVQSPRYNVLSYTWGYYKDHSLQEPALRVYGVDWPIPPIKKDHFTPKTFHQAIRTASTGIKHQCEWLWVDIACIPQEHKLESEDAKAIRGEEIGSQVEIFHRAQESFSWMSSLNGKPLGEDLTAIDEILEHVNLGHSIIRDVEDANEADKYLQALEAIILRYEKCVNKVLDHKWLESLWTLQEMVLRPDSWLLFDDGICVSRNRTAPWNFNSIKSDVYTLKYLLYPRNENMLSSVVAMASKPSANFSKIHQYSDGEEAGIFKRLHRILAKQEYKGLTALAIDFPHSAYSIASHRRVTKLHDRIYGIVQTYGISCTPFPRGNDELSQLHALEDEFGEKLVAKAPLLSQVFVHGAPDHPPRRSWLITQDCKVDDPRWESFTSKYEAENLFETLLVTKSDTKSSTQDIYLQFSGRGWPLDDFVERSAPSQSSKGIRPEYLFHPSPDEIADKYNGLILDHHVSKNILGRVVERFDSYTQLTQAVERLQQFYQERLHQAHKNAPTECPSCQGRGSLLHVALLGSGSSGAIPMLDYVGLVLVPLPAMSNHTFKLWRSSRIDARSFSDLAELESQKWERIGLIRWKEAHSSSSHISRHYGLPRSQRFECLIQ